MCYNMGTMGVDPNVAKGVLLVVVAGIILLAFTYLIEFFLPLIIGIVLLIIAYLVYKFFTTGTLGF